MNRLPPRRSIARLLSLFLTIKSDTSPPPSHFPSTIPEYLLLNPSTSLKQRFEWIEDVFAQLETAVSAERSGRSPSRSGMEGRSEQAGATGIQVRLTPTQPPKAYILKNSPPLPTSSSSSELDESPSIPSLAQFLSQALSQFHSQNAFPPILAAAVYGCETGTRTVEDVKDIFWYWRTKIEESGSLDWEKPPPWLEPLESDSSPRSPGPTSRKFRLFLPSFVLRKRISLGTAGPVVHDDRRVVPKDLPPPAPIPSSSLGWTKSSVWPTWIANPNPHRPIIPTSTFQPVPSNPRSGSTPSPVQAAPSINSTTTTTDQDSYTEEILEDDFESGSVIHVRVRDPGTLSVVMEADEEDRATSADARTTISALSSGERNEMSNLTRREADEYRGELLSLRRAVADLNTMVAGLTKMLADGER
ncbi:hypothetical protein T439DRAFT_103873 [Meredithblackwellia eburnea MCA 4105]